MTGRLPLRAECQDRTGAVPMEITAGIQETLALVVVGRPGHFPLAELTFTAEQLADLHEVVRTLRQTIPEDRS